MASTHTAPMLDAVASTEEVDSVDAALKIAAETAVLRALLAAAPGTEAAALRHRARLMQQTAAMLRAFVARVSRKDFQEAVDRINNCSADAQVLLPALCERVVVRVITDAPEDTMLGDTAEGPEAWAALAEKHVFLAQEYLALRTANADVVVVVGVASAVKAGCTFQRSSNGVVLSRGNARRVVPPECFATVLFAHGPPSPA